MTTTAISTDEFNLLKGWIEKECGISLGDDKAYLIESRLARLIAENGCETYREFYNKIKLGNDVLLRSKIIDAVTTNETLWFRDQSPFTLFKEVLLPQFAKELETGQRQNIKIWSAACSTGQEPYSLAMLAHEYARETGNSRVKQRLSILATDISNSALMLAKTGKYDEVAMSRGMPADLKERYFRQEGRLNIIHDELKALVTFQPMNLQNSFLPLGQFDVILMRNVAIYFSMAFKTELVNKMAHILNPGGSFIIGSSESLTGLKHNFELKEHGRSLYYQVKNVGAVSAVPSASGFHSARTTDTMDKARIRVA